MKNFFCGLLLASVFLGGCAKSPQQVVIAPTISVESGELLPGKKTNNKIALTVYDERPSSVMGSRGGVYGETSLVSTGEDFTRNIRAAAEQALQEMGLTVSSSESASEPSNSTSKTVPQFQLYIDRFSYDVLDSYFQDIEIKAAAHVVVTRGGQRFTGRYNSDLNQRLMTAPSNDKNDEMVNQVLDDVLARVFNDDALKVFLKEI